jgi:hypothetical protein
MNLEKLLAQINELEKICGITNKTKLSHLEENGREATRNYLIWLKKQCPNHWCLTPFEEMWPENS